MVRGAGGFFTKVTASVLLEFSVRKFAEQNAFRHLPWTFVASRKLEAARMSSACPDAPTLSPEMQRPWPVVSRCFSRESITIMNRVGDRTDPCSPHG